MKNFKISTNDACGTSLQDYVETGFTNLVKLFGEPSESDGYKSSTEWTVEDEDGNVATIYDYKATNLYDSEYASVEEFRSFPSYGWHIGAFNENVANDLIAYINAQ